DREALAPGPPAPGPIFGGGHPQPLSGLLVDPAARAEAGFVDGMGDRDLALQVLLQGLEPAGLEILPRGHPHRGAEGALEAEGGHPGAPAEDLQGDRVAQLGGAADELAEPGHLRMKSGLERLLALRGVAAQAGPEAIPLRRLRRLVEAHVLPAGP